MKELTRRRFAGVCSLLATVGVVGLTATAAQAAPIPIGPDGPGTTCDPNTNGSNVAQLCGVNFTTDAGNPGPYTVAAYQNLSNCPAVYNATVTSITTTDAGGTPPGAFASPGLQAPTGACTGTNDNNEVGSTARVTGTHAYSTPGTYTNTTTINYQGKANPPNQAAFCLAPNSCPRTASGTATVLGLGVTKTGPANVVAGQQASYTLTVTNNAATTSYGPVTVTDVLPANVVFAGGSPGCTDPSPVGGTVTCPVANSLAPGSSVDITIVVVPTTTSSGPIANGGAVATGTALVAGGTSTSSAPSNTVTTQVAPQCTATIANTTRSGFLVVPNGQRLCVTNSTIIGSIEVDPGGALVLTNSSVSGGIISTGATAVTICGSTVTGSVSVTGTTGQVRLGGDAGDPVPCAGNTFRSSVKLQGNTGGVELTGNTIGGAVIVENNSGAAVGTEDEAVEVEANRITGTLSCTGNVPGVTNDGTPNTAGTKIGQCTSV
jgi:uncharacterized repeat protein (TIGR01451 family)